MFAVAQPSWGRGVKNRVAARLLEPDAELMLRVRAGDQASFGVLLERHRRPVVHFLSAMVRNEAIAEELAQEVFLRVYRSRERYQPTAKFTTWLFRIATHLGLNSIRDGKNERFHSRLDEQNWEVTSKDVPDQSRTAEQELLYQSKLDEIRNAIGRLPAKQRAAVTLHKYNELEYTEIARVLGCSDSAVKSLLFRAYGSLRTQLAHMA